MPIHSARRPSQLSAASPWPAASAVPQVGQPASTYLTLRDVDALHGEHRVDDRLPGGRAEQDGLAFELLQVVGAFALAEGEAEGVARAPVEGGLELHAVLEREREHARRGEAHVGLADIDELHRRGAVRRAGLHVGLDAEVGEIAHLLADPVRIVVEHFERAARRDPGELRVGLGAGAADAAERGGGHDAGG